MKNILKVTILFCMIMGLFVIPSFASDDTFVEVNYDDSLVSRPTQQYLYDNGTVIYYYNTLDDPNRVWQSFRLVSSDNVFACVILDGTTYRCYLASENTNVHVAYANMVTPTNQNASWANNSIATYDSSTNLYYGNIGNDNLPSTTYHFYSNYLYSDLNSFLSDVRSFLDTPPAPTYNKNANVDEFIANTLISMGVKFDTPADALSYASDAWDWCIDEENRDDANEFDEWDIDAFVSYCNAQSNNYLNWYNGYKVSVDVTKALGVYIRSNIQLLTGLPSGIYSLTASYLPIGHYGSGFNSGATNPSAQTFYPAQTITYFNGEYVNETDDISTSQFLYTPPDVRRFLGYPGSSPTITPSSPTGTGTITDDPNNPDQKNITINFPALDWLADAIKSILDFLRDAFTTLANLLTQLLDAILGLFSDAFEGLTEFGEGFIEFLQTVFTGFSDVLSGFVPTDIATILVTFLALNIGLGLITFVLKGH